VKDIGRPYDTGLWGRLKGKGNRVFIFVALGEKTLDSYTLWVKQEGECVNNGKKDGEKEDLGDR
jgi:hypothetical protein